MDAQPKKRLSPLTLVLIIIIVLLLAVAAFLAVSKFGGKEPGTESLGDASPPLIGYEEGVTVVDDADALQKAVNDMYSKAAEGGVPISFRNDAVSEDGTKVQCYIANPADATYDVFITIFADAELTDQIYLSGLIPPGKALQEITLDHKLDSGSHVVYVAYTQVDDDHATIRGQAIITMDFSVK